MFDETLKLFTIPKTDERVIALFKRYRPKSLEDITELGLSSVHVGSGASRSVYTLTPTLAVKLAYYASSDQSQSEIAVIECIYTNQNWAHLIPHTPPLYYADRENGVILTKYYPKHLDPYFGVCCESPAHRELRRKFSEIGVSDLWEGNVRDDNGTLVAIDLGCYF